MLQTRKNTAEAPRFCRDLNILQRREDVRQERTRYSVTNCLSRRSVVLE
jgi:hypothetical protein